MSRALAAALLACTAGVVLAAQPAQPGDDWALQLPADAPVVYRGAVNFDDAGAKQGSAFLYPAPGVAGLLAAILTHGAIVESTKSAEKTRLQEEADRALLPFREQLADFRYPALLQLALDRLPHAPRKTLAREGEPPAGWLAVSAPVFWLTQDQRALILDNTLALFPPGERAKPAYTATVRVVSRARGEAKEWSSEAPAGSLLKEESAQMVAHSLGLALRHATATAATAAAFKTFRFAEGATERMERAQLVDSVCERVVMRTLRGWLLSAPAPAAQESPGSCEGAGSSGWR